MTPEIEQRFLHDPLLRTLRRSLLHAAWKGERYTSEDATEDAWSLAKMMGIADDVGTIDAVDTAHDDFFDDANVSDEVEVWRWWEPSPNPFARWYRARWRMFTEGWRMFTERFDR